MTQIGTVYLVGAGPGDPDLITVKGAKCLQHAEVVIYDRLANPALLDYVPPWAERIYAGKEPGRHRLAQDKINALLIQHARQGKTVVRLKGGDPFVFGRGGEEGQVLAQAGIPFELVPGVTSAIAVPAYAGIPVTQRHVSQSFTVITGHSCQEGDPLGTDWDDLPRKGTLVVLMGVRYLYGITRRLIAGGRDPETPAAIIRWGAMPQQEVVVGTLADIAQKAPAIRPPAVLVMGEVVGLRRQLDWFAPYAHAAESGPLAAVAGGG